MKKVMKKLLAFVISISIALSGVLVFDLSDIFTVKSEAVILGIGDTIEFGCYPQTMVTDSALISILEELPSEYVYENIDLTYTASSNIESRTYLVEYGGGTYFKRAISWRESPEDCEYNYYKVEPINWIIINGTGNGVYLLSEKTLDSRSGYSWANYISPGVTNSNVKWEESQLNKWLNKVFINLAFSSAEKSKIVTNSETGYKVFIPSYSELTGEVFKSFATSDLYREYWFATLSMPERIDCCAFLGYHSDFSNNNSWCFRRGNAGAGLCYAFYNYNSFNEFDGKNFGRIYNCYNPTDTKCGVRPAIYVDLENIDIEALKFKESYPTLEEDDAINFLKFIYNQSDDSKISASDEGVKNDYQYKILTGEIFNEDLSISEIQNLIADFCWLVENIINRYIFDSQYMSTVMRNHLKDNMEKAIFDETVSLVTDELVDGLGALVDKKLGEVFKIQIKSSEINEAALKLSTTKYLFGSIALADDIENFCKSVDNSLTIISLANNSESFGRYSYFNAYLNNRDNPYYEEINKASFGNIADATVSAKVINFISWIIGKDSWQNHKDDIDRWAEQFYQLQLYAKKDVHKYDVEIDEPTCTELGTKKIICAYCDELKSTEPINAKGHTYKKTTYKATCDKEGYDFYQCVDCGVNYKENITEKTEHKNYTKTIVSPTCTVYGYYTYVCECGETWSEDYSSPICHSYSKTIVEPTETEQGYTIYECSECNNKYFDDYTNPTGHEFSIVVTEPTCDTEGFTTHTCNGCGYEYVDSYVDIKEHSYQLISETKATCTLEGSKEYLCDYCGATSSEKVCIKEHDYTYGTRIIEHTCEEQGYVTHICVCGAESIDEYTDALGHDYSVVKSVAPSCSTDGLTKYECSVCGYAYSDVISKTEHNYEIVETVTGNCLKSSYTLKKCTVCDGLKYENCIYADGHDVTDWKTEIQATSTTKGLMKRSCVDCDYVETKEIPYKIYIIISQPKNRTISYGESMKLYSNVPDLPAGYKVKWSADSKCVSLDVSLSGKTCAVTSTSSGNVVIKAYIVDSSGNIIKDENGKQICDSEYFYSEANLWLRIVYFFRKLFGISVATAQLFKGVI